MPKSVGIDLINFLTYRTKYLIVLAPEFSVQGAVNGVDSESHISVWSEMDFIWHDRWAWDSCFTISLFLLRGYQAADIDFNTLVDRVNASKTIIKDFYGHKEVRPVDLKKQIRLRVEKFEGKETTFRPL